MADLSPFFAPITATVAHGKAGGLFLDDPRQRESHGWRLRLFDLIQCGEPNLPQPRASPPGAFGFLIFTV
jgi:hypothetical protein